MQPKSAGSVFQVVLILRKGEKYHVINCKFQTSCFRSASSVKSGQHTLKVHVPFGDKIIPVAEVEKGCVLGHLPPRRLKQKKRHIRNIRRKLLVNNALLRSGHFINVPHLFVVDTPHSLFEDGFSHALQLESLLGVADLLQLGFLRVHRLRKTVGT